MNLKSISACTLIYLLATCFAAAQDPYATVHASCLNELKLSSSGCDCVVDKAKAELDQKELSFLVAAISNNPQAMVQAQSQLSGDQMMTVTNFMTVTPSQCQNQ